MSGWGGVLAAMAHGLGTGIIKNVEQGWRSEELDKQLAWREKEADKQRAFDSEQLDKKLKHDFELDDHRTRNAISEAAARARISAQYSRSGSGSGGVGEAQKNLTGAMQVLGVYDTQLNSLQEKLSTTEDKAQRDAIMERINSIKGERANYLNRQDTISAFKGGEQMGRALYMTSGGDMNLYSPKPVSKTVTEDIAQKIEPPARNLIDANALSAQQLSQIAKQKQEELAHQAFSKASEEAKEWAAQRNQYKPSIFVPRPF